MGNTIFSVRLMGRTTKRGHGRRVSPLREIKSVFVCSPENEERADFRNLAIQSDSYSKISPK
jgi:hypothetical protein